MPNKWGGPNKWAKFVDFFPLLHEKTVGMLEKFSEINKGACTFIRHLRVTIVSKG